MRAVVCFGGVLAVICATAILAPVGASGRLVPIPPEILIAADTNQDGRVSFEEPRVIIPDLLPFIFEQLD